MFATLTDDADRMPFGCDTFDSCPVGDRDIMSDEHDMACGRPKCGGARIDEDGENYGCPGCRHCFPPDPESKPHGWGIERFEDPALVLANADLRARLDRRTPKYTSAPALIETWGMYAGRALRSVTMTGEDMAWRDFVWRARSAWDEALFKKSERVWGRLCDKCETHRDAVERYTKWADKATA